MRYLFTALVLGLLSLPVQAQLKKGQQFIGFGTVPPLSTLNYLEPATASDLAVLGPISVKSPVHVYALPNYGLMLTNRLQLHFAAGFSSITAEDSETDYLYSLGLGVRAYAYNSPSVGLFASGSLLLNSGVLEVAPGLGLSLAVSPNIRLVPEVNYAFSTDATEGKDNRIVGGLGIEFVLGKQKDDAGVVEPDYTSGSTMIGTSAITLTRLTKQDLFAVRAYPSIQWLVSPNLSLGINTQYFRVSDKTDQFPRTSRSFALGPVIRKFMVMEGPMRFFLEGSVLRHFVQSSGDQRAYFSAGGALGFLVFLRSDIALEVGITHQREITDSRSRFYANKDLTALTFGGRFFID